MMPTICPDTVAHCAAQRAQRGYVPLAALFAGAPVDQVQAEAQAVRLATVFNAAHPVWSHLQRAARSGDDEAANLEAWMLMRGIALAPFREIPRSRAEKLETKALADPVGFIASGELPYAFSAGEEHWAFDIDWIRNLQAKSGSRLKAFNEARRGDVAILVGNGPSLKKSNLGCLEGHDVYVTNYAINHPDLARLARGVAVSNYFVASQEPEAFFDIAQWRILPLGLSHVLEDTPKTIWLHALGGPLFFSNTPHTHIAWHATVSYFWMQVLLAAGYRKLVLIGFDNSYSQPPIAREGHLLEQHEDDANHFDPGYFKGKIWQAADTDHMAATYALAKHAYERAGCEIVNCTIGGKLELFRRSVLEEELSD